MTPIERIERLLRGEPIDQCAAAGVPLFVKQLQVLGKLTRKLEEFPKDLQLQQFPEVRL